MDQTERRRWCGILEVAEEKPTPGPSQPGPSPDNVLPSAPGLSSLKRKNTVVEIAAKGRRKKGCFTDIRGFFNKQ